MQKLRGLWIVLTLGFLHVATSPLLAQVAEEAEEGKSWVMQYIFTGMLIGLGVAVVGYGTGREINEARKNEQKEAKAKEERLKKLEQG